MPQLAERIEATAAPRGVAPFTQAVPESGAESYVVAPTAVVAPPVANAGVAVRPNAQRAVWIRTGLCDGRAGGEKKRGPTCGAKET